ncbi:MAG: PTS sugar transporter subunit IIA [Peptoniphilaceae bacterium]|nr:PTS sugar transporter subunit IIA [Peptoniphilaceae bacterium]MDY6018982.1 PTS sugar transporter subunit IIA [Anaerococcus sp.]
MDSRKVNICYFLSKKKRSSLEEISEKFKKTERTIRKDIDKINVFLSRHNLGTVNIEYNEVLLDCDEIKMNNLLSNLSYSEYYLDNVERNIVIILFGLLKHGYFTIKDLTNFMQVSRSTVNKDLEKIKKFINNYDYQLISEPSIGIKIEEISNKYRLNLILDLINFDIRNVERFFNQEYIQDYIKFKNISDNYIEEISDLIHKAENKTGNILTNYSFELAKYFLAIYIIQINEDEVCNEIIVTKNSFVNNIMNNINGIKGITANQFNVDMIESFINTLNFSKRVYKSDDLLKAQIVTNKFIKSLSQELGINFNNDQELFINLSNHLSSIIENPIEKIKENSAINDLVKDYPEIRKAVKDSIQILRNFIERDLNELEINYVVIYVITSLEKKKNCIKDINILVVCSSGVGTSFLIKENIRKVAPYYNIEISTDQSYIDKVKEYKPDLIVSTVKLDNEYDYILVDPVLSQNYTLRLLTKIDEVKLDRIRLANETSDTSRGDKINSDKHDKEKKLTKLLPESRIRFDVDASDWKDAIRKSAQDLLRDGCIEKQYIDAMIKNIEKYGPYIVVSKGVAVPHASSKYGVNATGMSLIKLKKPVILKSKNTEISYLICMASRNNEHLKAFLDLVKALQDERIKKRFVSTNNSGELFNIFKEIES